MITNNNMTDKYILKYIRLIKNNYDDAEAIEEIIEKIYSDGHSDGLNDNQ